jgi:hypothetical protein
LPFGDWIAILPSSCTPCDRRLDDDRRVCVKWKDLTVTDKVTNIVRRKRGVMIQYTITNLQGASFSLQVL